MIYLGFLMAALPFVAMFLFIVKQDGFKTAVTVFGLSFATVAWIGIAVKIIEVCK